MAIVKIIINGETYRGEVEAMGNDRKWDNRNVHAATLAEDYETMTALFPAGQTVAWSVISDAIDYIPRTDEEGNAIFDEEGNPVVDEVPIEVENDQSKWCVPGAIIDNRNGTFTVKMGTRTDGEKLAETEATLSETEAALDEAYEIMYGGY